MSLTDQSEMKTTKSSQYNAGHDAYRDGIMYEQNPYKANTWEHSLWQNGWIDAEGEDMDDMRD